MLCCARTISKDGPRCSFTKLENKYYCLKHDNLKQKFGVLKWGNYEKICVDKICKSCGEEKLIENFYKYSAKYDTFCKICRKNVNKNYKKERENLIKIIHTFPFSNEHDVKFIANKFQTLRKSAIKRRFSWNINIDQMYNKMIKPCYYCNTFNMHNLNTLGRIDALKGYELTNIIPVCNLCVMMKNNTSVSKFIKICKHISTFNNFGNFGLYPEEFDDSTSKKYFNQYLKRSTTNFKLTKLQFENIIKNNCHYCGKNNNDNHSNGIDRIDAYNRNYDHENIVSCCKTCNRMKYRFNVNDFLNQCYKVAKYNSILININIKIK